MRKVVEIGKNWWREALLTTLTLGVPAYMTMAKSGLDEKIDRVETTTKVYVDTKHDKVMHILDRQTTVLDRMDKRIYEIHGKVNK